MAGSVSFSSAAAVVLNEQMMSLLTNHLMNRLAPEKSIIFVLPR